MSPLMILQKMQFASEDILEIGAGWSCLLLLQVILSELKGLSLRLRAEEGLWSVRIMLGRYINVER